MNEDLGVVKIGMVANFWLTETLFAVAEQLEVLYGCDIHWFTVSRKWARWLRRKGVARDHIVRLSGPAESPSSGTPTADHGADEPDMDYLISVDRVLGSRPVKRSKKQLNSILSTFERELQKRGLEVIFGEATWTHEVLMSYAARRQGVQYLAPISVRIPSGRIAFAPAPTQASLLELPSSKNQEVDPSDVLSAFWTRKRDVGLWSHNRFSVEKYLRQPKLLLEKIQLSLTDSAGNPSQHSLTSYCRDRNPVHLARNARNLRAFMREHALRAPSELAKNYVLVSLHVQPEASIDIVAWKASDQLANIRELADALGDDVLVAVKEHSHRFGSRSLTFFKELAKLDNVVFVDPNADSHGWMTSASAVVTPSGTMALENALEGRKSVLLAPMWFESLPTITVLQPGRLAEIREVLDRPVPDTYREAALTHMQKIVSHSRAGNFASERDVPGVAKRENVANLARAFFAAIEASVANKQ